MAPLRVIPYNYVPTKRRPCNNDHRSSVDKHPGTHHITQQSKPGVLPEKALQPLIAESPGDARGAGEKSRHNNVHEAIVDEQARQGIQDPASILNAEVSLSGVVADQDTLGRETDYGQVEFTDNGIVDIDPSSDFDFDFDSIFGDIDAVFEEQEVSSVIKCNSGHATNPHADASAGQTVNLASGKESANTDAPSSCSSQPTKRRTSIKRRREEDYSSVVMSDSNSDNGISDESDDESIFELRQSKRSRSGSLIRSPDSSICTSDVEEVAKSGKRLSTQNRDPVADSIERENESPAIGPGDNSNLIHDINLQTDDGDLDSDDDHDDELCHSPSWYRFGPIPANSHGDDVLPNFARPCYVAQVEDAYRDREFHNIIGKEDIDGEVYYMVDWVPTLVRGHILRKAQAQPLISSFEARCQSYKEGGKGHGDDRSNGYGATDGIQQRKRRGRPRNQV